MANDTNALSDDDLDAFNRPASDNVKPPTEEAAPPLNGRTLSPQEREQVCKAVGVPLATKGALQHHIKLKTPKKTKSKTVGGEIRQAFANHGIDPADLLVKQIKMEASKIEVYERSEAHGVPQHVLDMLPKPDYERLDFLLLRVMKFYVPVLSSTEITGTVDHALKINLVQFKRTEERVIEHDEKSPAKLLAIHGQTLERGTEDGVIEVPLETRMRESIENELQNTTLKAKRAA